MKGLNQKNAEGNFVLAPLEKRDDYLEPYISEQTVSYHYWEHLKNYINNVNALQWRTVDCRIEEIVVVTSVYQNTLYKNASQVFNHHFYFEQLNAKGIKEPLPKMMALIEKHYGSLDNLKECITEEAMSIFGSGWLFLTTDDTYKICLFIRSFEGTGTPIQEVPLLALDMWEHAYYLDYKNDKKKYIQNFFSAIDWGVIESRLINGTALFKL